MYKIINNNNVIDLRENSLIQFAAGEEAYIYITSYADKKIILKIFKDHYKDTALKNLKKYNYFIEAYNAGLLSNRNIVFPQGFIYDENDGFRGIYSEYIENSIKLNSCKWSKRFVASNCNLNDETLAYILCKISDALQKLHEHKIFYSDLNLQNIIVALEKDNCGNLSLEPYLVDFDSCTHPDYSSSVRYKLVDPSIRGDDIDCSDNNSYMHSAESDWWALANMAFELFTGTAPWDWSCTDNTDNKRNEYNEGLRSYHGLVAGITPGLQPLNFFREDWLSEHGFLKKYFEETFTSSDFRTPIKGFIEKDFGGNINSEFLNKSKIEQFFPNISKNQDSYLQDICTYNNDIKLSASWNRHLLSLLG